MAIAFLEQISHIITGSEEHHLEVRCAIIFHMLSVSELVTGTGADGRANYLEYYNGGYSSVKQYLDQTRMADNGTWGTN